MKRYDMTLLIEGETYPLRIEADTHDEDGPDTVFYGPALQEIGRVRTGTVLNLTESPAE